MINSIKMAVVGGYLKATRSFLGLMSPLTRNEVCARVAGWLSDGIKLQTKLGEIVFYCPGEYTTIRAETFFVKEPETLEWIESLPEGDVLWDVGANVGCYSLYAGRRGLRVCAFEPSFGNYFVLNKNIELNRLDETVTAFCLALSDSRSVGTLHMPNTLMGAALNQFSSGGDAPVDKHGEQSVFKQGMVSYSVDELVAERPELFPNHIKIDVDGIEESILAGAKKTLADPRLKSVAIEVEEDEEAYVQRIVGAMEEAGLRLHWRRHAEMYETSRWSHIYNYVFKR